MNSPSVEEMRRLRDTHAHPHSRRARARRFAKRGLGWLRARALLADGATLGRHVVIDGHVRVVADGSVQIGDHALFLAGPIPTEIVAHEGARLVIGDSAIVNYGASFEATESIIVGKNCMFGSYVRITDRDQGRSGAIFIDDDVWVAHGAYIGPGVTIGRGAVVAAGSVVTADVPPERLAIGNPARSISLALIDKNVDRTASTGQDGPLPPNESAARRT
jgi:acetyltransferase-like isoleucine patch superfamily enzyme